MPILTRDERKSKDNDDEQEDDGDNDVATSAEAPPRLDGGSGGKNGKDIAPAVFSSRLQNIYQRAIFGKQ